MKALLDALARLCAPPLWLAMALAVLLGAALLLAFIETLQENLRHGEEFRQWQRVGAVRQPIGTLANAAPRAQPAQFATTVSQSFQR